MTYLIKSCNFFFSCSHLLGQHYIQYCNANISLLCGAFHQLSNFFCSMETLSSHKQMNIKFPEWKKVTLKLVNYNYALKHLLGHAFLRLNLENPKNLVSTWVNTSNKNIQYTTQLCIVINFFLWKIYTIIPVRV